MSKLPKYDFDDEVTVSSPGKTVDGESGTIEGKVQNDDGSWYYAVTIKSTGEGWCFEENEILGVKQPDIGGETSQSSESLTCDLRQSCRDMIAYITEETRSFPQHYSDYWHLHLRGDQRFIDADSTAFEVRRLCVQALVNRAHHLVTIAPAGEVLTRVIVLISWPKLLDSQIIVFFGTEYFNRFFIRNTEGQRWSLLSAGRSLIQELNISIPEEFSEKGYLEEINEGNTIHKGENWFIGQLT